MRRIHHPNYQTYRNMLGRIFQKGNPSYHKYGAKGIKICDRWLRVQGFENFCADMGIKPSLKYSLDRKNGRGNYEPDNCRWATSTQQILNRSLKIKTKSGYRGVFKRNPKRYPNTPWWAAISSKNKGQIFLGGFKDKKEAALAYNNALLKYHGEEAVLMLNKM